MRTPFTVALLLLSAFSVLGADDPAKLHAIDFATKAAMSNLFEIEAAKIEVVKGEASDAKQFAEDMLKDHGKALPLLADAAKQDGIEAPVALDAEYSQKLAALKQSDETNLDRAYLSTQVTAHQQAVELFTNYSKEGPDGQLKNAAAKIVPDLRMHLTRVQGLISK